MEFLKGQLLIASPALADPNFCRTVVFLAEHNAEGAFGVVLNRPGPLLVSDLWKAISQQPSKCESKTYDGGPVQKNSLIILHGFEDLSSGDDLVIAGVHLGSEIALLERIIARGDEEPLDETNQKFRLFCGYSGWGAGQLDAEMKAGGWLTLPATSDHIFHVPAERLWNLALGDIGGPYKFFSLMPPDPEHN